MIHAPKATLMSEKKYLATAGGPSLADQLFPEHPPGGIFECELRKARTEEISQSDRNEDKAEAQLNPSFPDHAPS